MLLKKIGVLLIVLSEKVIADTNKKIKSHHSKINIFHHISQNLKKYHYYNEQIIQEVRKDEQLGLNRKTWKTTSFYVQQHGFSVLKKCVILCSKNKWRGC